MSETGKAVFLSYASQDADAALRLCSALRAAGIEVWFDADGGQALEIPPDVLARFLKLWSQRTGVVSHQEMEAGRPRPAQRDEGVAPPTLVKVGRALLFSRARLL